MERALTPEMLSTDLAYYLVRKGVSIQACREQNHLYPCAQDYDSNGTGCSWARNGLGICSYHPE